MSSLRSGLCALLLGASASALAADVGMDLRAGILSKLEYDRTYFARLLALKAQGKTDSRLSTKEFDAEVERARANSPILERLFQERADYEKGKPFTVPANSAIHRVYANLVSLLNVLQATGRGEFQAALDTGRKMLVTDKRDFGLVRADDDRYYLNLYREYFYLMAQAYYRLGNDGEAVKWLARIEANADLQALKKKLDQESKEVVDPKAERLAKLVIRAVALLPLGNLTKDKDADWLGAGLAEVLTNDLAQHSDLVVVERTQLAKVIKEVGLSQAGITEPGLAKKVGELLSAGTLITGAYRVAKDKTLLTLRLVDAETGQVLAAAERQARSDALFADARSLLVELLGGIGWMGETSAARLQSARAPEVQTIRRLQEAKLLLATKSGDAKALYAQAIKEDPEYAKLFNELEAQFKDVTATVAVVPFVNVAGNPDDLWMTHAVAEALSTDLPKLGFQVVERSQLAVQLEEHQLGQVLDPNRARELGQLSGADFLAVGSLLHQSGAMRADLRFVDVRTGNVLNAVTVEGQKDKLSELCVNLSVELARRFNEKLSDETVKQLSGRKMGKDDFEKYARQQLQKEQVARQLRPVEVSKGPSRAPFWLAAGGAAAGTLLATGAFVLADRANDQAAYSEALLQFASRPEDLDRLEAKRQSELATGRVFNVAGYLGVGLAVGSVGYLVYQELRQPPEVKTRLEAGTESNVSTQLSIEPQGVSVQGSF